MLLTALPNVHIRNLFSRTAASKLSYIIFCCLSLLVLTFTSQAGSLKIDQNHHLPG